MIGDLLVMSGDDGATFKITEVLDGWITDAVVISSGPNSSWLVGESYKAEGLSPDTLSGWFREGWIHIPKHQHIHELIRKYYGR